MLGLIIFVAAVLVVLGTSVVKQVNWSTKTKHTVAAVLSVIGGGVVAFADNGWDFSNFADSGTLTTIAAVYGGSQAVYQWFVKNSVLDARLESVGQRTE